MQRILNVPFSLPTPPCPITSPDHWGPHSRPLPPRRWSQPHAALLLTPPAGIFFLSGLSSVQADLLRLRFSSVGSSSLRVSGFGPQEGRRPGAQKSGVTRPNSTHSEEGTVEETEGVRRALSSRKTKARMPTHRRM